MCLVQHDLDSFLTVEFLLFSVLEMVPILFPCPCYDMPVCYAGLIITVASAGGIFPMPMAPVYATAKSGVIHFTRSLAPRLKKRNIRICALCPQQVDTPMVS